MIVSLTLLLLRRRRCRGAAACPGEPAHESSPLCPGIKERHALRIERCLRAKRAPWAWRSQVAQGATLVLQASLQTTRCATSGPPAQNML
eukprot:6412856-Alexandrium_andersonii.AAC.2